MNIKKEIKCLTFELKCCNIVLWLGGGSVAEKTINFKVDAEIYKRIKIQVAEQDTTLKDYILSLIMKDLPNGTRFEDEN